MNGPGKSDRLIVPVKQPNNARVAAEAVEGSGLTKGNAGQQNTRRTQSRGSVHSALERIRSKAKGNKKNQFTSLFHHIIAKDNLREAFLALRRDASAGVDGETWQHYAERLESNLDDLRDRLQSGAYRAKPVRRVYIPKSDGRLRPLGVPVLEDKLVQRATVTVLNAIYETDFAGFSYGFRPGRNQHQALNALNQALGGKVRCVVDADIRGFFDTISHEELIRFIEHRIKDRRVVRLIQKWLAAGVLESEQWRREATGTPQGGSISPLLANIYLHYVLDLWVQWWRKRPGRKNVIIVRYADDFVTGFESRSDAEQFLRDLRSRLKAAALELHPEKTRLIEFGRFAASNRRERDLPKPETFNFLGFTHVCGTTLQGNFTVIRRTQKERLRAKLQAVRLELRKRMHHKVPDTGRWLASVLRGHFWYYGISFNSRSNVCFRNEIIKAWKRVLQRRSQRSTATWARMQRLADRWLPKAEIVHKYTFRTTAA